MQLVPGPRRLVRESLMLSALPRGLVALGRLSLPSGVRVRHVREAGDPAVDAPPPLPSSVREDQTVVDGHGPLLHRTFRVEVPRPELGPRELVAVLAADMNQAMVPGIARFDRVGGDGRAVGPGDEFVVRMPGPWDGPVRVVDRVDDDDRSSFRLATLAGHLEAGQIEFAATRTGAGGTTGDDGAGGLCFTITTWARAGDLLADLMYNRLGVAREIQYQLWVHCCVRAAGLAGGPPATRVDVVTRSVPWSDDLVAGRPDPSAAPDEV